MVARERLAGLTRRVAVLVLSVAACGRLHFDDLGRTTTDATVDGPPPCRGPYQPARNLAELNSPDSDGGGMISADGLELYFGSNRPGGAGGFDIYVATRTAHGMTFGAPVRLASIATAGDEDDPYIEPDGLTLWWQRGTAIVRSARADRTAPWPPGQLVPELDTGMVDQAPGFTADGLTVYFSSQRPGSINSGADLYRAERPTLADPFGPVTHEATASSNSFDCCPEVSAGGTMVVFTSQRNAAFTQVWAAPRAADGSLGAASIYQMVDSPDPTSEYDVFGTPDDTVIGVSSNRPGGLGGYDIWLYERSCP